MIPAPAEVRGPVEPWLEQLRARFVAVAARRVRHEAVEDLVHEALRVVLERGIRLSGNETVEGLPSLAWCFQVLRNTIGNFYQKDRTRAHHAGRVDAFEQAEAPTPLDALEAEESSRVIRDALRELRSRDGTCGRYLERLAEGADPAQLAAEERLAAPVLYRRLYRCRHKLRALLEQKGVLP